MANHKSQHFVPRSYLKRFSLRGEGHSINLYNISQSKLIRNASVKGQCAKNYIYGDNLEIEQSLQYFESEYGRIVGILERDPDQVKSEDMFFLRSFMMLQFSRTEAAILRTKSMFEGFGKTIEESFGQSPPGLDLDSKNMMLTTLRMFTDFRQSVFDLHVCVVRNKTRQEFITSDDPVCLTSKLHAQKLKTNSFGVGSSGAIFFFPITPRLLLICFDGDVYSIPDRRGSFVSIDNVRDVSCCNELQYANARNNLYFANWSQKEIIEREISEAEHKKGASEVFLRFVEDSKTQFGTRYRMLEAEEVPKEDGMLIGLSQTRILPSKWMSKIRFRRNIKVYGNGSAAGPVRQHTWNNRFHDD